MIIDVRTRFPGGDDSQGEGHRADSKAYHAAMACLDASIVSGFRSDRLGVHDPIESIAAMVNESPSRRIGFAGIDPLADSALDEIDRVCELGLSGVTISPADQGCRVTNDRCLQALDRCAQRRLPVLVANPCLNHAGSTLSFARPEILDEAAGAIDGLTLLLGDIGAGWIDESFTLASKHSRVFVEISGVVSRPWALYNTLVAANERGVIQKLLFGSGYPAECPSRAIERIYTINSQRVGSAMPMIPRESLRRIIERDALACLGIDHIVHTSQAAHTNGAPVRESNGAVVAAAVGDEDSHDNGRL